VFSFHCINTVPPFINTYTSVILNNFYLNGSLVIDLQNSVLTNPASLQLYSPTNIYDNFQNVKFINSPSQYNNMTFTRKSNLWTSTTGSNNQYFILNQSQGKLYVLPTTSYSISLTSSQNPSVSGNTIVFTANVTGDSNIGIPTGNITFKDNNNEYTINEA
jgi:hypothetical protein